MKNEVDFDSLPSLMSRKEMLLLHETAGKVEGNVIEVGSWKGGSTILIASKIKNGKVYAIDPHKNTTAHEANEVEDTFKIFLENIEKFGISNKVVPIRKTSKEAFESWGNNEVAMVFIDGNHEYEHARYDIEKWMKFLKKGGLLVVHDFGINGDVASVVFDCVVDKARFVKRADSLVVFVNEDRTPVISKINLKVYKEIREFLFRNSKKWYSRVATKTWGKFESLFLG